MTAGTVLAVWLWQAAVETPIETGFPAQWETLGRLGLAGLVITALSWFALRAWSREIARGDRLEADNKALNTAMVTMQEAQHASQVSMQERVIPALTNAVNVINEVTELMRDIQHDRERDRDRDRDRDYVRRDGAPH